MSYSFATHKLTVRDSINTAIEDEMRRDSKVFVIGEEVGVY